MTQEKSRKGRGGSFPFEEKATGLFLERLLAMKTATWTKHGSDWAVFVTTQGQSVTVGETIIITKSNGECQNAEIKAILQQGANAATCTVNNVRKVQGTNTAATKSFRRVETPDRTPIAPLTTASEEQQSIFARAADMVKGMFSLIILALAGTGKTTVLVQLVRVFAGQGLKSLCLAFSGRDRDALTVRCQGNADVRTSNSAGLRCVSAYCRANGIKFKPIAVDGMAGTLLKERLKEDGLIPEKGPWEISSAAFSAIITLVDKARIALPLRYPQEPSEAQWLELKERFGIEWEAKDSVVVLQYIPWLFQRCAATSTLRQFSGTDFTNQVFLPVYHNWPSPDKYDRVLVDEAQDQNPYNRPLACKFLAANGRLVVVGDANQAIYEWRGADSDSLGEWHKLITSLDGREPESLPLTLCRRCCKSVIAMAQKIVPSIQALPEAPEGSVEYIAEHDDFMAQLLKEKTGLVLSRVNAPLLSICLKLLANGVRAVLARSNIVAQLISLVELVSKGNGQMDAADVIGAVEEWRNEQKAKYAKRRDGEKKSVVVDDKADCIIALAQADGVKTAQQIKDKIDNLFPKNWAQRTDTVLLSTVHGAKGGEAETVYLYSPIPKKGKSSIFDAVWSTERDRDNTLYVATTRAEKRLFIVGPAPTYARFSSMTATLDGPELDLDGEAEVMALESQNAAACATAAFPKKQRGARKRTSK